MSKFKKVTAVIFDMDGVISDTQKYHAGAEAKLLEEYGITLDPDTITARFAGVSDDEMFSEIFEEFGKDMPDVETLVAAKWAAMDEIIDSVDAIDGSVELIRELHSRGYPIAVASSSPHSFIKRITTELDVIECFDALVSADDVTNGKPAPDIFLLAAEKIGASPEECLVIEDGHSGIIGAKKANMYTAAYLLDDVEADLSTDTINDIYDELFS